MQTGSGRIALLRHAETAWSLEGRHTGRTDVPLTADGEARAQAAGERLREIVRPALVLASPLSRAWRTAELAGFPAEIEPDLVEWDYGAYEGRTTTSIRDDLGDASWTVWTASEGLGEPVEAVGERAARVLDRCRPVTSSGADVLLVAHAHLLRVLTAVHLGLPARAGARFVLGAGAVGLLGHERSTSALLGWGL